MDIHTEFYVFAGQLAKKWILFMNSVHFFLFSLFGCLSKVFFGQLHPFSGTPNFVLPPYGPWPVKLLSGSGISPKTELVYNFLWPRLIFSLKCSILAFWGYFSHFEDSAAPRGILPKVSVAGITNSIRELTLTYQYKVRPDFFWYVGRPTV